MNSALKKWLVGCSMAALMAFGAFVTLAYVGYKKARAVYSRMKEEIEKSAAEDEAARKRRRDYLEEHLSQETRDSIPEKFYTYDGFRDWWRMPLVFPYQLQWIDTFESAYLERYDPKLPIEDPNQSTSGTSVSGGIVRMSSDNRILVYETKDDKTTSYGLFVYESGENSEFKTEAEAWAAADKAGFSGVKKLIAGEEMFNAFFYGLDKVFLAPPDSNASEADIPKRESDDTPE